jgi:hypothetical protein
METLEIRANSTVRSPSVIFPLLTKVFNSSVTYLVNNTLTGQ